ncbi:MAG: CDP-alcohol phosphatidyltransferase family protein, partial [Rhizobiales bacterium]|nr:CDP-alcohol phosphatidyltransferase family protein [Hyphomicrobiales bacterium]
MKSAAETFAPRRGFEARRPQRALLLSLPNILTYGRIIAVPLVVFCVVGGRDAWRWIALALFIAASITDYFDGYLARIWKQQSSLGRMLDPIADKLLVSASILALVFERTIDSYSIWAALIILSHDVHLVARHAERVAVMYGGRIVEIGDAARVLRTPAHPYTRALLRAAAGHEKPGERLTPIA